MNKDKSRHIWLFVLFVSLLSCEFLHNTANAQGDLTLYKYRYQGSRDFLIIAHRSMTRPLPILLDANNFAPISSDDANSKQAKQSQDAFVELVLGKKKTTESVKSFQKDKLDGDKADGKWEAGTWKTFARKTDENALGIPIIDLSKYKNKIAFSGLLIEAPPLLATYDLDKMKTFAEAILSAYRSEQRQEAVNKKLNGLTNPLSIHEEMINDLNEKVSVQTGSIRKLTWAIVVIGIVVGVAIMLRIASPYLRGVPFLGNFLQNGRQEDGEPGIQRSIDQARSQFNQLTAQAESIIKHLQNRKAEVDTLIQPLLDQITEIEEKGTLEQLQKAEPKIQIAASGIDDLTVLISAARKSAQIIEDHKSGVEKTVGLALDCSRKIEEKGDEINQLLESGQEMVSKSVDTIVQEAMDSAAMIEEELKAIQQTESKLREFRVTAWEGWIQAENRSRFSQAEQQLLKLYRQSWQKQIDSHVSTEVLNQLHRAKRLLEDFCGRLTQARIAVPASISYTQKNQIEPWLNRLDPFPWFQMNGLKSLQDHNAQQVPLIIAAIQNQDFSQLQSYESYVQQVYIETFTAYAEELHRIYSEALEVAKQQPSPTDETLHNAYPNLARKLLDAFDLNDQGNESMVPIIDYYQQRVIPPLLDAFGFEEIPITIGQTSTSDTLHEIIRSEESTHPSGTVIEVQSKGWRHKNQPDHLLRKADVIGAQ